MCSPSPHTGANRGVLARQLDLHRRGQNGPNTGWSSGSSNPSRSNHVSSGHVTHPHRGDVGRNQSRLPVVDGPLVASASVIAATRSSSCSSRGSSGERVSSSHSGWSSALATRTTRRRPRGDEQPVITDRVEAMSSACSPCCPCRAAATVDDPRRARGRRSGCSPRSRSCSSRRTARVRGLPRPQPEHQRGRSGDARAGVGIGVVGGRVPDPRLGEPAAAQRVGSGVERRPHVPRPPATRRSRRRRRRAAGSARARVVVVTETLGHAAAEACATARRRHR